MFDFERMDVYQASLKCLDLSLPACKVIPRGSRHLADQLKRSSSSISLNIAEGAGEFSPKEKARFYRMALRSATESASTIQILYRLQYLSSDNYNALYDQLTVVAKMLTRLIASMNSRP